MELKHATGALGALRRAEPDDARAIAAIYAPIVRETAVSFELEPPTEQVMQERMLATLPIYPWLVAENKGEVVGYAYASRHRERAAYGWSVDVSAYVRADVRRLGIGRSLYRRLLILLRLQRFRSAFAGIALPNPASVALHESVGFAPIGVYREVGYKFGRWHDVGWWGLALARGDAPPGEIVPFAKLTEVLARRGDGAP